MQTGQSWSDGGAYDEFIGRWSRLVAPEVVAWTRLPRGAVWVDAGCGTGMVTRALLDAGAASVLAVDRSEGYVQHARERLTDSRVRFEVADVVRIPARDSAVDGLLCGLVLNFLPDPHAAMAEFLRVVRPGGVVAAYVWDYADGMELLRGFWDAAMSVDPAASALNEGVRFPLCALRPLWSLFEDAGLVDVEARTVEVDDTFPDGEAVWRPFLGGQGPGPAYVATLDAPARERLRAAYLHRIGADGAGPVRLAARAIAARGRVPVDA